MIVSPIDIVVAFVAGMGFALFYKWVLQPRNPDLWYLGYLIVMLLWANLIRASLTGTPPWVVGELHQTELLLLGIGFALAYPLWYRFGAAVAFFLVGRTPAQGGSLWIYLPPDYTASFTPSWEEPRSEEQSGERKQQGEKSPGDDSL